MSSVLRSPILDLEEAVDSVFIENETPIGVVDGVNVTFTLANTPKVGKVHLFLSGLHQTIPGDYSIVGNTITYVTAPPAGSYLIASYHK